MDRIFYMEVGRSAVTGGGEFWMEVEDNNIAQNMHHAINNAMSNSSSLKDEGPRQRMRSSSANEASKPISVLQRRHTTQKLHSFSPLGKIFKNILNIFYLILNLLLTVIMLT
jgi:insulin receptor substrate 1